MLSIEITPGKKTGNRTFWNVDFQGERLLTDVIDPEHAACRSLKARGHTGKLVTHVCGTRSMIFDIERGAEFAISDGQYATTRVRFREFSGLTLAEPAE